MQFLDTKILLDYLARKDNKAYQQLYDMYYIALKSLAHYYIRDYSQAADMVQEVFISLLESNRSFSSLEEIKYFLYNALKNRCISHLRKQKVRDKYRQETLQSEQDIEHFWEKVLEEDVYANLMTAIATLPPQCRTVMQLSVEGLKISEIAGRMQISEDTVKEYKKNGKSKLARILDNPFLHLIIVGL